MFYEIVRKLPEGAQVVLEASGDRAVLAIRAGRSRFTLQTLPESDFPDLAAGDMTHTFTLAAADLKRLIDKTQFAISTEETRYYLNGIYLHTAGTGKAPTLRAVATDGHRLAQVELPLPAGAAGMPGVIVPRKTVGEVQRLIEDSEAEVDGRAVAGQDPLHARRRGADLQADRRHVPGLRRASSRSATTRSSSSTRRSSSRRSTASRRCRASAAARSSCRSPAAS